ncbi:hypothetical protein GN956_G23921 [Arapaima gigas]
MRKRSYDNDQAASGHLCLLFQLSGGRHKSVTSSHRSYPILFVLFPPSQHSCPGTCLVLSSGYFSNI